MIRRCDRCGKPLTEFETTFHKEAGSPPAISEKCWICSGAEMHFMDGYTDKPHHRVEIFACIVAIALMVVAFLPLVPYLNQHSLPIILEIYSKAIFVLYVVLGVIVTRIIHRNYKKKPKIQEWDPPMNRYQNHYGPNTDIYTTKINRDGDFVTTKETRLGGSIEDKWGAHASSGSSTIDKISNFYGDFTFKFLTLMIYVLLGASFAFWALPYVLVMISRDKMAKQNTSDAPAELVKAYRHCRSLYGDPLVSYDDKAGYLVSRENHKVKKAETANSFLAHYKQPEADSSWPYFYTRKNGVAYMIHCQDNGIHRHCQHLIHQSLLFRLELCLMICRCRHHGAVVSTEDR